MCIALPFYPDSQELRDKITETSGRYSHEEMLVFDKMQNCIVQSLKINPEQDFLGAAFMEAELYNNRTGQFFTPYEISRLMSQLNFGSNFQLPDCGYVTIHDPAVGAGCIMIAARNLIAEAGHSPGDSMYVECWDIDYTCFCMCYIQLSILYVPAAVVWGDTLALKRYRTVYTPAFFLNDWPKKLVSLTGE